MERKSIEQIAEELAPTLRRMAQNNSGLLEEYRGCIEEITVRRAQGLEVPEAYIELVDQLRDKIIGRMNEGQ